MPSCGPAHCKLWNSALYGPSAWVERYKGISAPTKLNLVVQFSRKRGKLCMPPLSLDSLGATLLPASGSPANAPRLFPAMIPARTEVSSVTAKVLTKGSTASGTLSAGRLASVSGYMPAQTVGPGLGQPGSTHRAIEDGTWFGFCHGSATPLPGRFKLRRPRH